MKRFVLPTLKVLIALVIAVALTKIAFFPSSGQEATTGPSAGFEIAAQTTTATVGDVSNTIDVKGQVVQDAAVNAPATLAGSVDSFAVSEGATVTKGEPLVYLKKVEPQDPAVSTDEDGNEVTTPVADKVTWATVYSPAAGTVSLKVLEDQETAVGDVLATGTPGTYSATGTITPSQQYQLTNAPKTASLTLDGGPAPFDCTGLTIGTKPTSQTTTDADGATTTTQGDGTSVEVRCPIPSDQKVFPGLPVTIGIDAGSATGAVLVPVTAVEGSTGKGEVWVVPADGDADKAEKRDVTLGVNDGTNVQVTDGLKEGETVLLFVPGKDTTRTGEPNTCDEYACYDEKGQEYL